MKISGFLKNKTVREAIILVLIAVVTFVGLRLTIQSYIVYGPSMQPNFEENQRIIANKVTYWFGAPQRGDVIVFKPPFNDMNFIKRVIGLPGEAVEIRNGKTYVYTTDGTVLVLDEPYEAESSISNSAKQIVPENCYYVMGDNRNNSNDSRNGWMVPAENIIGKAWLSIWPPDQWGLALNYPFPESTAQAKE
ncbi:MAG TPA: signal peptidase I [Dehalococcoidales bacterium]